MWTNIYLGNKWSWTWTHLFCLTITTINVCSLFNSETLKVMLWSDKSKDIRYLINERFWNITKSLTIPIEAKWCTSKESRFIKPHARISKPADQFDLWLTMGTTEKKQRTINKLRLNLICWWVRWRVRIVYLGAMALAWEIVLQVVLILPSRMADITGFRVSSDIRALWRSLHIYFLTRNWIQFIESIICWLC